MKVLLQEFRSKHRAACVVSVQWPAGVSLTLAHRADALVSYPQIKQLHGLLDGNNLLRQERRRQILVNHELTHWQDWRDSQNNHATVLPRTIERPRLEIRIISNSQL